MAHEHLRQSRTVFDGAKFNVHQIKLTGHDGQWVQREVVVPADAVVILPMLDSRAEHGDDAKVVLIRNERFAVGKTLWELPAGTRETGEAAQNTAARELTEETGYEAQTLDELTWFYPSPGFCTEQLTAFLASGLTHRGQKLDPTERIAVEAVPISRALAMIQSHEIEDAKTIATLLYAQRFAGEAFGPKA